MRVRFRGLGFTSLSSSAECVSATASASQQLFTDSVAAMRAAHSDLRRSTPSRSAAQKSCGGGYMRRLRGAVTRSGYEGRSAVVTSGAHRQLQLVAELDGICVQVLEQRHEDRVLDLVDLDLREKGGEGRRRSEKVGDGRRRS